MLGNGVLILECDSWVWIGFEKQSMVIRSNGVNQQGDGKSKHSAERRLRAVGHEGCMCHVTGTVSGIKHI